MKNPIWLRLFTLPFIAVGVWMLYSITTTLLTAADMKTWKTVQAQVLKGGYTSHQGKDAKTYEAYATYRYRYNGQEYESTRIAIDDTPDNIGSFHQDMGNKLSNAAATGAPIDVFVNPGNPSEAVIDRDIRWSMVGFKLIFVIAFGGAGLGLLAFTFMESRVEDPALYGDKPWMAKPEWAENRIVSGTKMTMYFSWGFAVIWNAISAVAPFTAYDEIQKGNHAAWLAFLFPLVGVGLLVWAAHSTIQWRKFGQSHLQLDPFPGSIGGQAGGTIELHYPYDPAHNYIVTLSSLHSYETGSGKNRRRSERVNWQSTTVAHSEAGIYGTRLVFRFDVPEGLPPSDVAPESSDYELWRVNVSAALPGVDLCQDYEIPVFPTAQKSGLSGRGLEEAARKNADMRVQSARSRMNMRHGSGGTALLYPIGRNAGMAFMTLFLGFIFTSVFLVLTLVEKIYFFGAVFGVFGVPMILSGFYMAGNSLHVQKDSNGNIVSTRYLFGLPVRRRHIYMGDIRRLEKSSRFATQSGARHIKHYSVFAKTPDGKKVVFGEGFHGEEEADAAIGIIRQKMGIGA